QVPVVVDVPGTRIPGDGYYSRLAWVSGYVQGSTPDVDESEAPQFLALIKAKVIKTPDGTGAFVVDAWDDNPVSITRYLLAHERYFNEGDAAMEDAVNYESYLYCNEYVLDKTQGERAYVPQADAS